MSQAGQANNKGGGGGVNVQTLTGNSGGPVPATANNINVIGSGNINVVGNPGTSTLTISEVSAAMIYLTPDTGGAVTPVAGNINVFAVPTNTGHTINGGAGQINVYAYTPANWIVDPVANLGTHQTIAAALAVAVSGDNIFIREGTYAENPTLVAGVNLIALQGSGYTPTVTINGTVTASYNGTVTMSGIQLKTNGATAALNITGANASTLNLINCVINASANTAITMNAANFTLQADYCVGINTSNNIYITVTAGAANFRWCRFSLSTGASTSAGTLLFLDSLVTFPITTSGSGFVTLTECDIGAGDRTFLTTAGTGTSSVLGSHVNSVTSVPFSAGSGTTIQSIDNLLATTNTNLSTGAGTFLYTGLSNLNNTVGLGATTNTPIASIIGNAFLKAGQTVHVTTPGAYPYTTLATDYVILGDSTAAHGITLIASPATGQTYRIKDNTGTAATHNITVTPSAGNIDGAGTYVIATNYGSVDLVYNGIQWNVF